MRDIHRGGEEGTARGGLHRRDFLRIGSLGIMGLTLPDWLRLKAAGQIADAPARSVIQLWMGGGPSQLDTFDPKPNLSEAFTGPLRRPLQTNVPGTFVSELLPRLATQADKYTILRGMTHGNNSHETSTYMMMTCVPPAGELVYPAVGTVVALKKGEQGSSSTLAPYITLTQPLGRFSEAGFLGSNYKTFATGGDPNAKSFRVQGIVPPPNMTEARLDRRRGLVTSLDSLARELEADATLRTVDSYQEQAYGVLLGDAKKAFDLSEEPDELRDRYGRHRFGQSCLLARRLVEHGVPFITINLGGWDTHRDNFGSLRKLAPQLDDGFATLLEDLSQRGLLESTIVVWYGEFGRTSKVFAEPPWFGGRHHYGPVFSAVVAGGGFAGGQVLGESDPKGEQVKERPVYPWDLSASLYRLLGIDPLGQLPHPNGCVAYVTPLAGGEEVKSGGLLEEIM